MTMSRSRSWTLHLLRHLALAAAAAAGGGCTDSSGGSYKAPGIQANGGPYGPTGGGPHTARPLASATPEQSHCLTQLNALRKSAGVAPLSLDADLTDFALAGSQALAGGGPAHGHFVAAAEGAFAQGGFCGGGAETQAPGWDAHDIAAAIDAVLQAMMDEGPGGGHHDAIINADFDRVGVGLVVKDGGLYFTNDFSPPCP